MSPLIGSVAASPMFTVEIFFVTVGTFFSRSSICLSTAEQLLGVSRLIGLGVEIILVTVSPDPHSVDVNGS